MTRALALLEALGSSPRGLKLSELARLYGLAPATCLRLLTTMQERGFVRFEARTGCWTIGGTAFYVGANFAATRHIVNAAEPIARQFSTDCRLTVNLGTMDLGNVRFLYRAMAGKPAGALVEQIPAHCSAIGKAMLASLPPFEAHDMLKANRLARLTQNSLADRHALFNNLERATKVGYAIDNEENTNGLRCVAAPIFDERHRPVAAISVAGPAQHLPSGQVALLGRDLIAAAERIMIRFGGHRPAL